MSQGRSPPRPANQPTAEDTMVASVPQFARRHHVLPALSSDPCHLPYRAASRFLLPSLAPLPCQNRKSPSWPCGDCGAGQSRHHNGGVSPWMLGNKVFNVPLAPLVRLGRTGGALPGFLSRLCQSFCCVPGLSNRSPSSARLPFPRPPSSSSGLHPFPYRETGFRRGSKRATVCPCLLLLHPQCCPAPPPEIRLPLRASLGSFELTSQA